MKKNKTLITLSIGIFALFLSTLNEREEWERKPSSPTVSKHPQSFKPPQNKRTPASSPSAPSPYQKIQKELSRFHHPDTHILIEKREELSPLQHRVRITYVLPDGRRTSFKAILDLKNQTLPRRWGRTIHENLVPPRLVPDGTL